MILFEIIFFIYLMILGCVIIIRTIKLSQAIELQNHIAYSSNNEDTPIGFFGCSALCVTIDDLKQIELLLTCDYYKYEVILSLNSTYQKELLHSIIEHYKLIKVNSTAPQEVTSPPILSLYRSRQRGFRRLIVVDSMASDEYEALNIALNISSYEYVIPIPYSTYPRPNAISLIATTISQANDHNIELIYCDTATPCYIFQRDALIDRNGFSEDIINTYPSASTHHLFFSLIQRIEYPTRDNIFSILILTTIFTAMATLCFMTMGTKITLCFIATIALAIVAARYIIMRDSQQNCSVQAMLYQISNLMVFFRRRKFTIS